MESLKVITYCKKTTIFKYEPRRTGFSSGTLAVLTYIT